MSQLERFDTVVFDLDDTLYAERDYVRSGFDYVGELVERLYARPFRGAIEAAQEAGEADILEAALRAVGLSGGLKDHLLAAYRYHQPVLTTHRGARELIAECRSRDCPLFLITDGRSLTQRLKLAALDLGDPFVDVFISEEVGRNKPDPSSFQAVVRAAGEGARIVYVADNPAKDFLAPDALGWTSIGVRHLSTRVHALDKVAMEPTYWVEELADLLF